MTNLAWIIPSTTELLITYAVIAFVFIFVAFLLFAITFVIYNVVKNEKGRAKYRNEMKIGDRVYLSGLDLKNPNLNLEIEEIFEDEVILKLKVKKDSIYPFIGMNNPLKNK